VRVLVVFDGSRESEYALDWVARLDEPVVTVLRARPQRDKGRGYRGRPDPSKPVGYASHDQLDDAMQRLSASGVDATLVERRGVGARPVLDFAGENTFDLVVIPIHRRNPIARFLFGSTAETVARRASTPVLLVRIPPKPDEEK
jgi:nucleotide-binding universal stress UspA family protein